MENTIIPILGFFIGIFFFINGGFKNKNNGENFIPKRIKDYNTYSKYEEFLMFGIFTGSKEEYEQKKKEFFEKYAGDFWPYKTYNGDGWYGSQFKFKPIDELYKYCCKLVPQINYDKLRLGKFITVCWH